MDYFRALELFELEPSAGDNAIEARYRELSKLYHPDTAGGSSEKMALVNVAYGILKRHSRAVSTIITTGVPDFVREQAKEQFEAKRKTFFEVKANPLRRLRLLTAFATLESPDVKGRLRANTEELVARGGFGSPTMFVDGDGMYFGNDRIPLVEAALARAAG